MVATVSVNESSASTRTSAVTDMAERLLLNAFPYLVNYHGMNLIFPKSTAVSYAANGSATGTSNIGDFMLMNSLALKTPVFFRSELFPAAYLPDVAPTKLKLLQTLVYPIIPVFREYLGLADEPSQGLLISIVGLIYRLAQGVFISYREGCKWAIVRQTSYRWAC